MRMTLACKGLLDHIRVVKRIEVEHQSKIRHAKTAKQAWDTLRDYYNRSNLQNRILMTRRLHEFAMESGSTMASHLDRFGELFLAMEAVGEPLDPACQMVLLFGSLPPEYDTIHCHGKHEGPVT
ncbi:TPA: hypothetical protein N0F65_008350 [Lagenidium giganteum]|uniref:Polyprotein n=1 Tax=Lagenidium giganteum TaxID=4803 RepID=A0AAV2YRS5_9STRA|nr:TPA: hypothetical protein N0F65_008350 [Lagenidium giganteum]